MHRLASKFVIFTLSLFAYSQVLAHGFETPEEAVNTYIKAVKTGSGEHVEMAFSETASIEYYDRSGEMKFYTRNEFSKLVNTGNQWNADIQITEMKKTGSVANATVEFTWGDKNEHGYVDYLNLINDGKSWHISNKVAQYVKRGGE